MITHGKHSGTQGVDTMTRFKTDMAAALDGDWQRVLTERKEEIERLKQEARTCKNKFRLTCIAQELARLKDEYEEIEERMV